MTGEDWVFDTVPEPATVPTPNTLKFSESAAPQWMIVFPADNPNKFNFHFQGQEVGSIDLSSGVMKFEGAVDDSAAVLFLAFKAKVDKYIEDLCLE